MTILDNSTRELGNLKDQVEPLVDFFKEILQGISHTVDEDLQNFLRPIVNGITEGSSPEEVQAIRVSQASKKVELRPSERQKSTAADLPCSE
jgi:hypothetical protein